MDNDLVSKLNELKENQSLFLANVTGLFCVFAFIFLSYTGFGGIEFLPCLAIGILSQYFAKGIGMGFRLLAVFYTFLCFFCLLFLYESFRISYVGVALLICCFAINYLYSTVDHKLDNRSYLWEARAKKIDRSIYLLPKKYFIFSCIFGFLSASAVTILLASKPLHDFKKGYHKISEEQIRIDG